MLEIISKILFFPLILGDLLRNTEGILILMLPIPLYFSYAIMVLSVLLIGVISGIIPCVLLGYLYGKFKK